MKTLASMLLLTLAVPAVADTRTVEMRITGKHKSVTGDTTESARLLALADARHKATQAAVAHLQGRADVKALRLRPPSSRPTPRSSWTSRISGPAPHGQLRLSGRR
jgi:molybdenum-dependent DNA-binding transcriptional regulator ModE